MKKKTLLSGVLIALVLAVAIVYAYPEGFNYNARSYKGWDADGDAWLIMKWSRDMDITAGPITLGSWITKDLTYYTNDYQDGSYGWDNRVAWIDKKNPPSTTYKITRDIYMEKLDYDPVMWAEYEALGAYDAGYGLYEGVVPKVAVLQDTVKIYEGPGKYIEEIKVADVPLK